MSDKANLTVIEQREVAFYEDELTAVRAADGHVYVSVAQMTRALGLDERSQRRRIRDHTILSEGYQRGVISTPRRGNQTAGLLRVDLVPLWLAGIRTKTVREEIRAKLERFQRESALVLWEAFQSGRLTVHEEIMQADTPAARAYQIASALTDLARQQYVMEQRLDSAEHRIYDNTARLDAIEAELGQDDRFITVSQAADLSQAVRAVGLIFGRQTGRNEYGGVYGELYRRYSVNSYKRLPAAKYNEAMDWLRQWYASLSDSENVPF